MKRKSYLLLLFVFLLLSACSNPVASKNTMIIKPSQFSAETQEVLSIFDDEVFFFDYSIDETIKSFSINLWAYQNGEWVENGATYGEEEFLRNRIAICTSNNNFDLFTIDETGYTKFTAPVSETYFSDCKSIAYMPLTKSTPIELNFYG
ncbi:hypothetical protein [Anaerotignum sp. MB30-C6]|uniref:hypothetical protein n=1 Tax=Anaerotignum sp. MB30-C6 TaxID=3070814 RepID=UPI0027DD0D6A|nr:hypothetical protein [Anaerotignum sp. MB30-C6]WMI82134.1 hypothetical protein RBQ60_05200 [Anaerotignum sp. MB30-C6]